MLCGGGKIRCGSLHEDGSSKTISDVAAYRSVFLCAWPCISRYHILGRKGQASWVGQNLDNPNDRLTILRERKYYILALNRIRHFLPLLGSKNNLRIGEARSESYLIIGFADAPISSYLLSVSCLHTRSWQLLV